MCNIYIEALTKTVKSDKYWCCRRTHRTASVLVVATSRSEILDQMFNSLVKIYLIYNDKKARHAILISNYGVSTKCTNFKFSENSNW